MSFLTTRDKAVVIPFSRHLLAGAAFAHNTEERARIAAQLRKSFESLAREISSIPMPERLAQALE